MLVQISDQTSPGHAPFEVPIHKLKRFDGLSEMDQVQPMHISPGRALRASDHIIYVDLPGRENELLLVHGYTGAFDKVSKPIAFFVRSLASQVPAKPLYGSWSWDATPARATRPSPVTLDRLIARGYLTYLTAEDEDTFFNNIVTKLHRRPVPQYIFMPTYDCNLRCSYCFQDDMRTEPGFRRLLTPISKEVIDRIFAGIAQIETHLHESAAIKHRKIGFFGGEPLLAKNRGVVEHIIHRASDLGKSSFWAVTNATELDAYEDLLSPERLSFVQITLDGPSHHHDKRRVTADRSGTFNIIARNIAMALEKHVTVSVRINVDRTNLSLLHELAEVLQAYHWTSSPFFSCHTAPLHATNGHFATGLALDDWELDDAQRQQQERYPVVSVITRPSEMHKHMAHSIFSGKIGHVPVLKECFCSAHTGMYIFDAFANIYACWERTGDPSLRIGAVRDDGTVWVNQAVLAQWRTRTVASNPVCRHCRYALYCGGGCAIKAFARTGQLNTNCCDGFASVFRAGVAEAYMAYESGAKAVRQVVRVCDQ